jgi:hypothetical protein
MGSEGGVKGQSPLWGLGQRPIRVDIVFLFIKNPATILMIFSFPVFYKTYGGHENERNKIR